jgi:hypothetical protein
MALRHAFFNLRNLPIRNPDVNNAPRASSRLSAQAKCTRQQARQEGNAGQRLRLPASDQICC